jgi:hypothetical protein
MTDMSYKEIVSKIFRTWPVYKPEPQIPESPHPKDLNIRKKGDK